MNWILDTTARNAANDRALTEASALGWDAVTLQVLRLMLRRSSHYATIVYTSDSSMIVAEGGGPTWMATPGMFSKT